MKKEKYIFTIVCLVSLFLQSCSNEWDNHYDKAEMQSTDFTIYSGDALSYLEQATNVSSITSLLKEQQVFENVSPDGNYTFIVCEDDYFDAEQIADAKSYAQNCVSDLSLAPSLLCDGYGIRTRTDKNIWVYVVGEAIYFDNCKMVKTVKADNGYIYYVEGMIPVRKSIYEYLDELGDDYSLFKALIHTNEERFFDKDNSIPDGVDAMGNTTYSDSVIAVRNTLMDRYTEDGLATWNMRSEDYLSTLFIPSNNLITNAINSAMDSIPIWLNREATAADTVKFQEWIVRASFVNQRLTAEQVRPSAADIYCVGDFRQVIDETQDTKKYKEIDAALWRPSIQKVDADNSVSLSNGIAYFVTDLKIPNHVTIYRVKSKFYQLWSAMTEEQQNTYFRWTNWTEPLILNDAQTEFTLSATMPTMYYNVLTAIPTEEARQDSLVCSVTYDGLVYNTSSKVLSEVHLPAGEYYLRMGFKHSLTYSISIYFNDTLLIKDMCLYAQGSNYHFDRGAASDMEYYGTMAIGYPEGYDWHDWYETNEKAVAYDTDGFQVGIVTLPHSGNFTITISSFDDSYIYTETNARSKNNLSQLMMYHWCLRPTPNNY